MLLVKMLHLNEPIILCTENIGVVMKPIEVQNKPFLLLHIKFRHKQVDPSELKLLHLISKALREIKMIHDEIVKSIGNRDETETVKIALFRDGFVAILLSGASPLWGILSLIGVAGQVDPIREGSISDTIAEWVSNDDVEVRHLRNIFVFDPKIGKFVNFKGETIDVPNELKIELIQNLDNMIEEKCFKE